MIPEVPPRPHATSWSESGWHSEAISIHGTDGEPDTAVTAESQGFWASLVDLFMPDEDRHTYTEGLNRGGYLLSAQRA